MYPRVLSASQPESPPFRNYIPNISAPSPYPPLRRMSNVIPLFAAGCRSRPFLDTAAGNCSLTATRQSAARPLRAIVESSP